LRQLVRFRTPVGAYALPVESVREVRPSAGLRSLPDPMPGVAGLLDWEGEALTVLSVLGEGKQLLVLDGGPRCFALLVDEVVEVAQRSEREIGPAPAGGSSTYVTGVMRSEGGLVLVLDADRLWDGAGLGKGA